MNKKRVELSVHTNMSLLDSVTSAEDYICEAVKDQQPAIAITDNCSVQALPKAFKSSERIGGIKIIYGCELHYRKEYTFYMLAKNRNGLKEMYKIISKAYSNCDGDIPVIPLDEVSCKDLILGISIMSEPIEKIMNGEDNRTIESVIKKFDYILLNPVEYFDWYTKGKIKDKSQAEEIIKRVIAICEKNNVLPIASDEAYFTFSDDGECRKFLLD